MFGTSWYSQNVLRAFPLDDSATCETDAGLELPSDILVDCYLRFPSTAGRFAYLSSVHVSDKLVSVTFVASDAAAREAGCTGESTAPGANFVPLASVSIPRSQLEEFRQYAVDAIYPGVGGWVVFGPARMIMPFSGTFSSPEQSMLLPKLCRSYRPLPVTAIGKIGNATALTGLVEIRGGVDVSVRKDTLTINGDQRQALVLRLESQVDENVLDKYRGPCSGRPESGTCSHPVIEAINEAVPDCNGNINIVTASDCAEILTDDGGIVMEFCFDMSAACTTSRRLPNDGKLPSDYVDYCAESEMSAMSLESPVPWGTVMDVGGGTSSSESLPCSIPQQLFRFGGSTDLTEFQVIHGTFIPVTDAYRAHDAGRRNLAVWSTHTLGGTCETSFEIWLQLIDTKGSPNGGLVFGWSDADDTETYYVAEINLATDSFRVRYYDGRRFVVLVDRARMELRAGRDYVIKVTTTPSSTAMVVVCDLYRGATSSSHLLARIRFNSPRLLSGGGMLGLHTYNATTDFLAFAVNKDIPAEAASSQSISETVSEGIDSQDCDLPYEQLLAWWRFNETSGDRLDLVRSLALFAVGNVGATSTSGEGMNQTQYVQLPPGTSGGTFTLTFKGKTTLPIRWNASATTVQTALQSLPTIGSGNVTVTALGPISAWTVHFGGTFGTQDQPLLAGNGNDLTIAGTNQIVVTSIQDGGSGTNTIVHLLTQGGTNGSFNPPLSGLMYLSPPGGIWDGDYVYGSSPNDLRVTGIAAMSNGWLDADLQTAMDNALGVGTTSVTTRPWPSNTSTRELIIEFKGIYAGRDMTILVPNDANQYSRACPFTGAWINGWEPAPVSSTSTAGVIQIGSSAGESRNEIQQISVLGSPPNGTFRLSLEDNPTNDLPYNISNTSLRTALSALPNTGEGTISISGGPLPSTAVRVEFTGARGLENIDMMVGTSNFLGGVVSITGVPSSRGIFDGSAVIIDNDAYLISDPADDVSSPQSLTINVFVRLLEAPTAPTMICGKFSESFCEWFLYVTPDGFYGVLSPDGVARIRVIPDNDNYLSGGEVPVGTWAMLTLWYDDVNQLYGMSVDAEFYHTNDYALGVLVSTAPLSIGRKFYSLTAPLRAAVDELTIWRTVLTPTQRRCLLDGFLTEAGFNAVNSTSIPSFDAPTAFWSLNEVDSQAPRLDRFGAYHLSVAGPSSCEGQPGCGLVNPVAGVVDNGVAMSRGILVREPQSGLSGLRPGKTNFGVTGWFKLWGGAGVIGEQVGVGIWGIFPDEREWMLGFDDNGPLFQISLDGTPENTVVSRLSKPLPNSEDWFMLGGTFDATSGRCRVCYNGELGPSSSVAATVHKGSAPLVVGGTAYKQGSTWKYSLGNFWRADDIAYFPRELTAEDFAFVYNFGQGWQPQ